MVELLALDKMSMPELCVAAIAPKTLVIYVK